MQGQRKHGREMFSLYNVILKELSVENTKVKKLKRGEVCLIFHIFGLV